MVASHPVTMLYVGNHIDQHAPSEALVGDRSAVGGENAAYCNMLHAGMQWLQGLPVIAGVGSEDKQQRECKACQGEGLCVVIPSDVWCTQRLQVCMVEPHQYTNKYHKQDRWPVPSQHLQTAAPQPSEVRRDQDQPSQSLPVLKSCMYDCI